MRKKLITTLFLIQLIFLNLSFSQSLNPFWQNYSSGQEITNLCFKGDTAVVASSAGISKFISGTGLVEHYNTINSPMNANSCYNILCQNNGSLWMSSLEQGLYHITNNHWELFDQFNRYNYGPISQMQLDSADNLFFVAYDSSGGNLGLVKYDGINFERIDSINGIVHSNQIFQMTRDYNGKIWLIVDDYIFKQNGNSWTLIDSSYNTIQRQMKITVDPNGNLWRANISPFTISKLTSSGWLTYDSTNFRIDSVNRGFVNSFYADPAGNIWAAVQRQDNKLFLTKFDGTNWTTYDSSSSQAVRDHINAIHTAPNGNTWFGTSHSVYEFDGLYWIHYDPIHPSLKGTHDSKLLFKKNDHAVFYCQWLTEKIDTNFITHYIDSYDFTIDTNDVIWSVARNVANLAPFISHFDGSAWITDSSINGMSGIIACDEQNVKWIYSDNIGLIKYTDTVQAIYTDQNSPLSSVTAYQLFCDHKGNLWINSVYVLQKFDGANWTTFNTFSDINFPFQSANGLVEDQLGNVWGFEGSGNRPSIVGKYDGVTWTSFEPIGGWPSRDIYSMAFDHHNNMWVSFALLGIGMYDGANWTMYTEPNSPIQGMTVTNLIFDRFDNLWISDFQNGLSIFNPTGIQFDRPVNGLQRVSGLVFHDSNSNGILDSTESGLQQQRILLLPDSTILTANSVGKYSHSFLPGDYQLKILPFAGWNLTTDSMSYHIHVDSSNVIVDNFGLNAIPFHSAEIVNNLGVLNCGTLGQVWINYTNTGSITDSGAVSFRHDSIYNFHSSWPFPDYSDDTLARWNFSGLAPFQTKTITAQFILPYVPGNIFSTKAEVNFVQGQQVVSSASSDRNDSIFCDEGDYFDIGVYPFGTGAQHLVNIDDTLSYTIRFKNTGTNPISFLNVLDTLDVNFDLSTFRLAASSHPVNYQFNNTVISFDFPGLFLPDSATDDAGSQGFVTFNLKFKNTTPDMSVVSNSAQIILGMADLFHTNEVFNTVKHTGIGIDELYNSSFQLFPNPAQQNVRIVYSENNFSNILIRITDILGREMFSKKTISQENLIDLTNFTNGFYIVNLMDPISNQSHCKRLIIQK